jgi:hypothetical protein
MPNVVAIFERPGVTFIVKGPCYRQAIQEVMEITRRLISSSGGRLQQESGPAV